MLSRRVVLLVALLPSCLGAGSYFGHWDDDDERGLSGWSFRTSLNSDSRISLFSPSILSPVFSLSPPTYYGGGYNAQSHTQHSARIQLAERVYEHYPMKCVIGHNIKKGRFPGKTREACAELCQQDPDCVGFELGMGDGQADYKDHDCQLNDGDDTFGCDAQFYGLEWYKLMPRGSPLQPPDEPVRSPFSFLSSNNWWNSPSGSVGVIGKREPIKPITIKFDNDWSSDSVHTISLKPSPPHGRESSYSLLKRGKKWGERTETWSGHLWKHMPGKCITGHNIAKFEHLTVEECADRCVRNVRPSGWSGTFKRCVGFEYGVGSRTGNEQYHKQDCQLNDSDKDDLGDCDASSWGFEFYLRLPDADAKPIIDKHIKETGSNPLVISAPKPHAATPKQPGSPPQL